MSAVLCAPEALLAEQLPLDQAPIMALADAMLARKDRLCGLHRLPSPPARRRSQEKGRQARPNPTTTPSDAPEVA